MTIPNPTTTEPPETVLDELTDTQRKMKAVIVREVKDLLWSELPKILRAELKRFTKPYRDAVKFWISQEKE